MLRGHATAKVDEKGRFKIPAEFSGTFLELCGEDRRTYMTSADGERILVYPMPLWEEYERKLASLPSLDQDLDALRLALGYWGHVIPIDGQGRLRIHADLLKQLKIDGTVSIFGKQQILEIWNHERLAASPPKVDRASLAALADKYGI